MHLCISIDPRQVGIYLKNDPIRRFQKRLLMDQAQRNHKVAVAIHGGSCRNKYIAAIGLDPPACAIVKVTGIVAEEPLLPALPCSPHQKCDIHVKGILINGIGQKAMRLKAHRCKHPEMFSAPSQMIHCIKNSRRLICALGRADDIPIPQGIQCFLYSYPFCPIFRLIAIHFIFLHIFVSAVQP